METQELYIQPGNNNLILEGHTVKRSPIHENVRSQLKRQNALDSFEQKVTHLNRELSKSHKELEALNAFSYSIAHDIRSPLNSISMLAHLIKTHDHATKNGEMDSHVEKIERQVHRLNSLIDDLLLFSRQDIIIEKQNVDMYKVVNEVVEELKFSYNITGSNNVHVYSLPTISCNPGLIRQVWTNLISNAIKYSRRQEHPTIKIGYGARAKQPEFWVKDNGIGFCKSESKRLFEAFNRLESAKDFEGTGVGLALCKRIIEKHGGQIRAKSIAGKETVFSFNL